MEKNNFFCYNKISVVLTIIIYLTSFANLVLKKGANIKKKIKNRLFKFSKRKKKIWNVYKKKLSFEKFYKMLAWSQIKLNDAGSGQNSMLQIRKKDLHLNSHSFESFYRSQKMIVENYLYTVTIGLSPNLQDCSIEQ